jgi:cell division septum initiation protein DivIVA
MTLPQLPKSGSALENIRTVEFTAKRNNYVADDVDEVLERVAIEVDALREQHRQTSDRLRQAAEHIAQLEAKNRELQEAASAAPVVHELAPAPVAEIPAPAPVAAIDSPSAESIAAETQRTLMLAQRFVEQTEREASETAARKIAEAEAMARQITVEAELRVRDEVNRLESVKVNLTSEIEGLANQLDAERSRLTGQLQQVLQWIDEHVQPSQAVRELRQANQAPAIEPAPESAIFQLGVSDGGNETA